jgi:hypothetical protein
MVTGSSEGAMTSVSGTVKGLLRDVLGRVNGFVLDGGEEIRTSTAQLDLIAAQVTLGSRIELGGDVQHSNDGQRVLSAAHITNLDSERTTSLPAPLRLGKPGMPIATTPTATASLAYHKTLESEKSLDGDEPRRKSLDASDLALQKIALEAAPEAHGTHAHGQKGPVTLPRAMRSDAAAEIERAYDSLHRIQAILAYLKIVKRQVHGISQMHEEAKHTYEQAMAKHATREFEGAREFACASRYLSRVIEGVISRTLRSDTSYPSVVPHPPEHGDTSGNSGQAQNDLVAVENVLSRVHWLLENGTLPLDDRAQVRKITVWSDAYYQQARRMYEQGSHEDAADLARAATDAAHSAEHICRNWYVAQAIHSNDGLIPAGQSSHA